ncbi:hypothetical protein [Gordonia rubripertincta]|uniref:Uncharacterized protein n=1 Tax=Gordonia rubripertincta TaxID=36822 RepID=A0ABT4MTU1_GORRU|nr:hypothetical protein [Gordonia rubripertincta]MCZ4550437.1 hypothetical protein [Gordonia rubripertincta]
MAQVLVAAAFVPAAPVLVPELSGPGVPEILPIRDAAHAVCDQLAERARRWMVVGIGDPAVPVAARGTFVGFGADVEVEIDPRTPGDPDALMPTSVLLAGWLAAAVEPRPELAVTLVDAETSAADSAELGRVLGRALAATDEPIGLLVVADGATTLGAKAPGGEQAEAAALQTVIDAALGSADLDALGALLEEKCAHLGVSGRAVWQLVAGALVGAGVDGAAVDGVLLSAAAPFGVGYVVARWDMRW